MASEWEELNRQTIDLMQKGHYDKALDKARQAVQCAEREKGEMHHDLAVSLNNLGELYRLLGADADAPRRQAPPRRWRR